MNQEDTKPVTQNSETINTNSQNNIPTYTYAGFWWRLLAYFIDGIIVYVLTFIPSLIIFVPLSILSSYSNNYGYKLIFSLFTIIISLLIGLLVFCYNAWFESSKYQATPGKMLLGIIVTDETGNRVSFKKALLRNISKVISGLIIYIGFIMAAFTEKNQALHDIIAKTLVLKKV